MIAIPQEVIFAVKLFDNKEEIAFRLKFSEKEMTLDYGFGGYHHLLNILSNGDFAGVVLRGEKTVDIQTHPALLNYEYDGNMEEVNGRVLNLQNSNLIAGAGNGIFGFGITKVEWFRNIDISLWVTDLSVYGFFIAVDGVCILNGRANMGADLFQYEGSHNVRIDSIR
jgi:hypothetical protein